MVINSIVSREVNADFSSGNGVEIYDCTLREGEQAKDVGFCYIDRLALCKRLDDLGVDYIELGWPIASQEIYDSFVPAIRDSTQAKIVAFGSTSMRANPSEDMNLETIISCGAQYACIFGKSDLDHVTKQLRISGDENLLKVRDSVRYLKDNGLEVFFDAEHFFDGFKKFPDYALSVLDTAQEAGALRIVLCDTNGGLLPHEASNITGNVFRTFKESDFLGVHLHDDCDLAMANTLAVLPYVRQVQGTINGLGERIGNLNLTTFIANYVDKLGGNLSIDLSLLKSVNEFSYRCCGLSSTGKDPYVGSHAFSHRGGVHINGVGRDASYEHTDPQRFGNQRNLLLNTLGGASSIVSAAQLLNFPLNRYDDDFKEKMDNLFLQLRDYELSGYDIGENSAEQYLLLQEHFGLGEKPFSIKSWDLHSSFDGKDELSEFEFVLDIEDKKIPASMKVSGGPVHAGFEALQSKISEYYPCALDVHLSDFRMRIARQHEHQSTVRTEVWFENGEPFSTVGVHDNMLQSSAKALEKGFVYHILREKNKDLKVY